MMLFEELTTVSVVDPLIVPEEAVMVVVPVAKPAEIPELLIVATDVLLEDQTTLFVMSAVPPPA